MEVHTLCDTILYMFDKAPLFPYHQVLNKQTDMQWIYQMSFVNLTEYSFSKHNAKLSLICVFVFCSLDNWHACSNAQLVAKF